MMETILHVQLITMDESKTYRFQMHVFEMMKSHI
jgi:hypothetical protein